jgi:hypothetical protein
MRTSRRIQNGRFGIEERSFVAKSAPLDDGQVRCGDEAAVIVTVKKLA